MRLLVLHDATGGGTKTSLRKGPDITSAVIWRDRENYRGAGKIVWEPYAVTGRAKYGSRAIGS